MAAAAHDPAFARKVGMPQRVAKEYHEADLRSGLVRRAMAGGKRGRR